MRTQNYPPNKCKSVLTFENSGNDREQKGSMWNSIILMIIFTKPFNRRKLNFIRRFILLHKDFIVSMRIPFRIWPVKFMKRRR